MSSNYCYYVNLFQTWPRQGQQRQPVPALSGPQAFRKSLTTCITAFTLSLVLCTEKVHICIIVIVQKINVTFFNGNISFEDHRTQKSFFHKCCCCCGPKARAKSTWPIFFKFHKTFISGQNRFTKSCLENNQQSTQNSICFKSCVYIKNNWAMGSIWGNNLIIGVQVAHNQDYIEHFDLRRMAIDLGIEAG